MSDLRRIVTTRDLHFLEIAGRVAALSPDPSTKVGAVITLRGKLCSSGWNDMPDGCPCGADIWHNREEKYPRVVHAEVNAVLRFRGDLSGGTIYTTHFPCSSCTGVIINSGITRVVTHEPAQDLLGRWPNMKISRDLLEQAGVVICLAPVLM